MARRRLRRRRLLAALAGASTVGGCIGQVDDGPDDNGGTPGDDDPEPTRSAVRFDPGTDDPYRSVVVGDPDHDRFPEQVASKTAVVWNDGPARQFELRVHRDGDPVHGSDPDLDAGAYVEVDFVEPAEYDVRLGVPGSDPVSVLSFDSDGFDCNTTTATVRVDDDGGVEHAVESTEQACTTPLPRDLSFEQEEEGTCGSDHVATVEVEADAVVVEGRVRTPVPCYDLAMDVARFDAGDRYLELVVSADERHEDGCIECVGEVGYELEVGGFERLPTTVAVRHREASGDVVAVSTWDD